MYHHIGTTTTQLEDIEELLIAEVQKRRELWDHTLPISARSRQVIASHWEEISKQLNGKNNFSQLLFKILFNFKYIHINIYKYIYFLL